LLGLNAAVCVAYVTAAIVGFRLAFVAEQITTVWAPTGIALAALLLGGIRVWPGIWLGALLANAGTNAPTWTAFVIATGNTLEAVAAVSLLRRLRPLKVRLERVADVLAFVFVAGGLCTAISATIGVITLCAAAVQPWERFPVLWFDWWLGDALGAMVCAPAIVTAWHHAWSRRDAARAAVWIAGSTALTHLVFGQLLGARSHPFEYVVFPLAIGAALSGGPPLTSLVVLSVSVTTIWNTVRGSGPFAGTEVHGSLILLQAFMGILSATALLLAAAVAERLATEHRERDAAADLRHREEMLQLAQRAGGVATFVWDFRNQVAECSAEFFRIFGLPPVDGVMTMSDWGEFVHPDDRGRMAAHLKRAIEKSEPAAADYRINAADGRTRWLSYAGEIETTPEGLRMLGTVVDISDRKSLEEQLRHHAAEVERILGSIGEGFVTIDRDFRYVYVNPPAEDMLGLPRAELIGRTPWEIFPDEATAGWRPQLEAAMGAGVTSRFESHVPGSNRWFENRVYPSATGLSIFFADVTARAEADAALRQAKIAAESANQLKDQFLATLSHELRTPLNAILGYARMLRTDSIAPEKRQRALEIIERNAVAQNELVEDLLDMSRITTGKVRLDPEPVPVVTVLREAVEGIKPAADAKGLQLAVDYDPFAGTVRADTTRLRQVFWNLLTNSVKFTSDGGRVAVSLRRRGAHVEIEVTDTGTGISPEFLPFVFEPFRQAESRFDRARGGLGLGLAITRQLIELHGGTIAASSPGLGHGATFIARLPCVDPAVTGEEVIARRPSYDAAHAAAPASSLSGRNILLVDGEEDTLTLFRDALEDAGASVRAVSSAAAAVQAIAEFVPDLLVADLGLIGMDGFQLLHEIRSRRPLDRCTAVAVSADARLGDRSRALAAGFQAHLAKPIDPAALVLALQGALRAAE
jgi:PAS domain S-box-containing protein